MAPKKKVVYHHFQTQTTCTLIPAPAPSIILQRSGPAGALDIPLLAQSHPNIGHTKGVHGTWGIRYTQKAHINHLDPKTFFETRKEEKKTNESKISNQNRTAILPVAAMGEGKQSKLTKTIPAIPLILLGLPPIGFSAQHCFHCTAPGLAGLRPKALTGQCRAALCQGLTGL